MIVRLAPPTFEPSPTYARVTPLADACGFIAAMLMPPTAAPLAIASASTFEVAVIVIAPPTVRTESVVLGAFEAAAPTKLSTTPLTIAVAKAPAPPPPAEIETAFVVAVAS